MIAGACDFLLEFFDSRATFAVPRLIKLGSRKKKSEKIITLKFFLLQRKDEIVLIMVACTAYAIQ